jgi:hypothetical protein
MSFAGEKNLAECWCKNSDYFSILGVNTDDCRIDFRFRSEQMLIDFWINCSNDKWVLIIFMQNLYYYAVIRAV